MSSLCWTVSNNYSDTAKYDEKQQTKRQRLSIFYTRFISCSLYYLASHHAWRSYSNLSTTIQNKIHWN